MDGAMSMHRFNHACKITYFGIIGKYFNDYLSVTVCFYSYCHNMYVREHNRLLRSHRRMLTPYPPCCASLHMGFQHDLAPPALHWQRAGRGVNSKLCGGFVQRRWLEGAALARRDPGYFGLLQFAGINTGVCGYWM